MNGRAAKTIRKYCAAWCIYHGDTTRFRRFYQGTKAQYRRVPFKLRHQWKGELDMVRGRMYNEIAAAAVEQGKGM